MNKGWPDPGRLDRCKSPAPRDSYRIWKSLAILLVGGSTLAAAAGAKGAVAAPPAPPRGQAYYI
jgi:hypothetical protein